MFNSGRDVSPTGGERPHESPINATVRAGQSAGYRASIHYSLADAGVSALALVSEQGQTEKIRRFDYCLLSMSINYGRQAVLNLQL